MRLPTPAQDYNTFSWLLSILFMPTSAMIDTHEKGGIKSNNIYILVVLSSFFHLWSKMHRLSPGF